MEWACAEGLPQNQLCIRVARHKHGRGLSDLRTAVQIAAAFKAHCKAGKDAATGRAMNCIPDEVSFAVPSRMNAHRQHLEQRHACGSRGPVSVFMSWYLLFC